MAIGVVTLNDGIGGGAPCINFAALQIIFVESRMAKGIYFLAELPGAEMTAVSLIESSENATAAMHTHAAKPLGGGKKGDASQMA